jgi:hypothetical protein
VFRKIEPKVEFVSEIQELVILFNFEIRNAKCIEKLKQDISQERLDNKLLDQLRLASSEFY